MDGPLKPLYHIWWEYLDLNQGPMPYQDSALPTELHSQDFEIIQSRKLSLDLQLLLQNDSHSLQESHLLQMEQLKTSIQE